MPHKEYQTFVNKLSEALAKIEQLELDIDTMRAFSFIDKQRMEAEYIENKRLKEEVERLKLALKEAGAL